MCRIVRVVVRPGPYADRGADAERVCIVYGDRLRRAFFWSGGIKLLFTQASHGVPAAGYASVYAVIGLVMILLTMDMGYLAFLFVSFIFLFLGRLGERAARWVFPERFR